MHTPKKRLERAIVSILRSPQWRYLSGVILLGKHEVREDIPTAATDGVNAYYGEGFISSLSDKELEAVVLHEVFHVLYKHLTVWRFLYEEDPRLANAACDYVINLQIEGQGWALPEGSLVDPRFQGMDSQQVFNILKKEREEGAPVGNSLDSHEWEEAKSRSPEQEQDISKAIDRAIRQGVLVAESVGANTPRDVLDWLTPKIDWREALRDFVTSTHAGRGYSTWRRPHRRHLHSGVYLPTQIQESLESIVVAVDTSGSVSKEELDELTSELQGLIETIRPDKLDVLYWGSRVVGHESYEGVELDSFKQITKPVGGGGTDVREVFKYIEERGLPNECVVVMTDGYTPWPTSVQGGVLFLINSGKVAPVGKTVEVRR